MDRRVFLKTTAGIAAVAAGAEKASAIEKIAPLLPDETAEAAETPGKLITSAPMLQNFAETSMGIAFGVSDMANGYVIYGKSPDMSDAVKVKCGGFRVTDMNPDVMLVRLTGLEKATKYYYRIGADRISYKGGYQMKVVSTEEDPNIYEFTTAGKDARAHFCVINDTHAFWPSMAACTDKIAELSPSCVLWNGDAMNCEEKIESLKTIFLSPEILRKDYASRLPYIFVPGNHDTRGLAARRLERVWMFRDNGERSGEDWDLGRNFAFRLGDIAMIGLDTAEDKVDENPAFAGLFNSEAYREAQTIWLKKVLKRKDIATAPFLVAFCHIPLSDSDPHENPGGIHPNDYDPAYTHPWASWLKPCQDMWGPLLEKNHCACVISAHQHRYRFEERAGNGKYRWSQMVGGGTDPESEKEFPTVIEGLIEGGNLVLKVHNLHTGLIEEVRTFRRR